MKHAKLFSILVFAVAAIYGIVGYAFLPLARFHGDLTRVGRLPESMFGWTLSQPAIPPALMQQSSWQEADVLVIGDSFSGSRVWQTKLTEQGLKVHTEHWNSVRNICEDFEPWVRSMGFKGRYIVLESIERGFHEIRHSLDCHTMDFHSSIEASRPKPPPLTSFDPDQIDFSGRMTIGMQAKLNTLKYQELSAKPEFSSWSLDGGAKVVRTPDGCRLFSHHQCQDALYMGEDRAQDIDPTLVDVMVQLNQRMPNLTPIWVVVPNKSTTYLYPDKKFWEVASARMDTPDVLARFRQALAAGTVDLYPGNESHLSTTGYLMLGDMILHELEQRRKSQQFTAHDFHPGAR